MSAPGPRRPGMDRRMIGIAVLLVALLGVAVLPALAGRRTAGIAVHAAVPVVGDCLADVTSWADQEPVSVSDTGWSKYSPSRASLGRCTDRGAGRVLSIRYGMTIGGPATGSSIQEQDARICDPAAQELRRSLAGPDTSWTSGNRQIDLRAVADPYVELIGAPVTAVGQWVACVPFLDTADGRQVLSLDGRDPMNELGDCRLSATSADFADCATPHRAEVIGRAVLAFGSPERPDYAAACREFFRSTTGLADPATVGFALEVRSSDNWSQGPGDCLAVVADPARTLSGSLVGLRGAPVPWTP